MSANDELEALARELGGVVVDELEEGKAPQRTRSPQPEKRHPKPDNAPEQWYRIPKSKDYLFSNHFRLMRITPGPRTYPGKIQNPMDRHGYACVQISGRSFNVTTLWADVRGRKPWIPWASIKARKSRDGG